MTDETGEDGCSDRPDSSDRFEERLGGASEPVKPGSELPTAAFRGPAFAIPINIASALQNQQSMVSAALKPMLDTFAKLQRQTTANTAFRHVTVSSKIGRSTDRLMKNLDLSGIVPSWEVSAKIYERFFANQNTLLKKIDPIVSAIRATSFPPNLSAIKDLELADAVTIVMDNGIPLYGLPRASTVQALIRADSPSARREVLGRRWQTISTDCRKLIQSCETGSVAEHASFAIAALDALDDGHPAAAQALAGSLIDTLINARFGNERRKYTPNRQVQSTEAYEKFAVREYLAFAPIWQAYQQFFPQNGDKIPVWFNRHATVHGVSTRQYNKRNAVQGLMIACSLIYHLNDG